MTTENNFEARLEKIKVDIAKRLGPAASIRALGNQEALPAEKTIRNLRSLGKIPSDIFFRGPSGILADTDRFLDWWGSRCSQV